MRLGDLEEIFECDPEAVPFEALPIEDPDSVETPELVPAK